MKAYHYATVPSEPAEGLEGVSIRWAIGDNVGAPNFITRIFDVQPEATTPYHTHPWEHEVFVLEGEGSVRNAQGQTPIGPGTCVYIEPDEIHQLISTGSSVLRFICIIPRLPEE